MVTLYTLVFSKSDNMEGEFPQKTGACFMQNTMVVWERDIRGIMKKERKMFRNASNRGKHIFWS